MLDLKKISDKYEVIDEARRKQRAKFVKEICKDVFDVIKNALILATVNAAYKATENTIVWLLFVVLFVVFIFHTINLVLERYSPFPQILEGRKLLQAGAILLAALVFTIAIMVFTRTVEDIVLKYGHGDIAKTNTPPNSKITEPTKKE